MIVWLAHPYGGDPTNLVKAKRWLQWASTFARNHNEIFPSPYLDSELHVYAPWIPLCEVLPETDIDRRFGLRSAMAFYTALQGRAFEVWTFTGLSPGTIFEMSAAVHLRGRAWDLTGLGEAPPEDFFDPREHASAKPFVDLQAEWWRVIE